MKLCMIFGWLSVDISSVMSSFGPASCLPQGIVSLHPWNAAGPLGKFMWQRILGSKGSRVHVIMMDFIIWGRLTMPRGQFGAQGFALTRNVARSHGSKNLLQRAILYRHKKIYLCQGRLQAKTRENYV